jgi:murein peptide amidase A
MSGRNGAERGAGRDAVGEFAGGVTAATRTAPEPLENLLAPLALAAAQAQGLEADLAGEFLVGGTRYGIERFRFVGPGVGPEPVRLGLFAGIHGDEPAGCAALVEFLLCLLQQPERASGYELLVYPVVSPTGYVAGTRTNCSGKDLNREFWRGSLEPEVRIIEHELRTHEFAGVITLHADDTCEGHYGYSHGRALDDALLRPALLAAERVLPRDRREVIDGFTAREGVISDCFHGILSAPPEQEPRPFNLIFETPAQAPFHLQVEANVAALDAILATYRGHIAYAQGI